MVKKIIAIIPDSAIWDSFLNHIKGVYGKTYGHIGMEVQNALKMYVESYQKDNIKDIEEKYQRKIQELESKHLKDIQNTHKEFHNDYSKLRNRYDHLQERFNKSQKDLNVLERETRKLHVVIAKIEKMSFMERILNRLPEEVKQLKSGKEKKIEGKID
jgi:chemotaxis protein histidine kinase CheA